MATMNNEALLKIVRKNILWAEITAHEQEHQRLVSQMKELDKAMSQISSQIQKRLHEVNEIGEWLAEREYHALRK